MNDFEAPRLNDLDPPRVFRTVTSKTVAYSMDFVEYLIGQEATRRSESGRAQMSDYEGGEFRRQLIAKVIIQGNVQAGIDLRPAPMNQPALQREQLNG